MNAISLHNFNANIALNLCPEDGIWRNIFASNIVIATLIIILNSKIILRNLTLYFSVISIKYVQIVIEMREIGSEVINFSTIL